VVINVAPIEIRRPKYGGGTYEENARHYKRIYYPVKRYQVFFNFIVYINIPMRICTPIIYSYK